MGVMLDCNNLTVALISPLRVVLTKYSSLQPLGKHYIEMCQLSVYLIVLMLLHKMSSQDFPPIFAHCKYWWCHRSGNEANCSLYW